MAGRNQPYESFYGVGLLDDLHNYFPAVLYEPDAFLSVRDLLTYISSRTRRRFDLYSHGRENYEETAPASVANVPVPAPAPVPVPVRTASGIPIQYVAPRSYATAGAAAAAANPNAPANARNTLQFPVTTNVITALLSGLADTDMENTIYRILLRPPMPRAPNNFMDPVIIRPTAQEVNRATRLGTPNDPTEVCAICQETIEDNQPARLINYCEHWFHANCIDVWFEQNVHCPVCRHDIRILEDLSGNTIPQSSTAVRRSRTRTTSVESMP